MKLEVANVYQPVSVWRYNSCLSILLLAYVSLEHVYELLMELKKFLFYK